MKKKKLCILLCICMVMSLMPIPVFAKEDPFISIGGVIVDSNDWYAITDTDGSVTTEGALQVNNNIHVVLDNVNGTPTATVTLKDATITNSENKHAINVQGYDLNIVLEGTENQIGVGTTDGYGNAIYSQAGNKVTITGQGDLTLKGYYGIHVNGLGEVNINTTGNLNIASEWQMVMTPGNITVAAKSIEATGYYFYGYAVSLTATDGDIQSTGSSSYGIQASGNVTVSAPNGAISISGVEYAIKATDYSINVAAKNDVTLTGTVHGKEISITSEAGNLTINGYYEAIEGAQTSVTLSAPSGDVLLSAKNNSDIISGSNNFPLAITAAGKLEAKGPYGIEIYGEAIIKADSVSVENTADGYGFNGGVLTITSPSGGNCSEVYISGGKGNRDAINAYRDVNIKADKVTIKAAFNAEHAINASSIMGDVTVTIGDTGLIVGAIYIKGTNAISAGVLCTEKNGNNASYGLNLNTNIPSQSTYYKAGDGYVIFTPAAGETPATLLLNNATIQNQTTLTDNTIGMENEGIALPTGNIIIKVEGTNSITSSYGDGIGYLGSHVTLAGSGILNVGGAAGDIMLDDGSFSFADGADVTLNGVVSVINDNIPENTDTVYGNMTVNTYFRSLYGDAIIASGATVTIPEGQMLWMDETDSITINGQLINNGTIVLPYNYTIEQIQALNLTGNILMRNGEENKYRIYVDGNIYAYGGKVDYNFSLSSPPTEVTYYETINGYFMFTPATDDAQAKLTLHNVDLFGYFMLPDIPLTFDLNGVNTIESIDASASIKIEGSGKLDVYDFKNSNADATLTVNSGATLNSKYNTTKNSKTIYTIYGNYTLSEDSRFYVASSQNLVLSSGAVFTLRYDGNLEFHSGATLDDMTLGKGASIVNNTHITLPQGTTPEQIAALPFSGSGVVRVTTAYDTHGYPEAWDTYTNEGLPITVVDGDDLTLTDTEVLESDNKGYTWKKTGEGDNEVWTLTLNNTCIDGSLYLPNKAIVINSTAHGIINGNIGTNSGYALDITFTGTAPLTIGGSISGGIDGDTVTVQDGAKVTVDGSIFLGSSGGIGGTLNVTGKGTALTASSPMGYAVMCDSVNVQDGAAMTVKAQGEDSIGVEALTGVSVTGGSTLTTGCDYGVYIIGGKLTVDESSKLITNASVAPFCIVDKTATKVQSDVLALPGIPSGTKLTSVTGTIGKYWSLIPTNGSLGVTDENNEPVTLTGATKGLLNFVKEASNNNGGGSSDGGGSSGGGGSSDGGSSSGGGSSSSGSGGSSTSSKTQYNLSKVLVDKLVAEQTKAHSITIDAKTVKFDLEALKAIQKQINADATLAAKKIDNTSLSADAKAVFGSRPVYDFTIIGVNGKKITDFEKGKISIAIPYKLLVNEKAESITAYYIHDSGKVQEISDTVYDEKNKELRFEINHSGKIGVGYKETQEVQDTDVEVTFTDIDAHWAKKDIEFVVAKGLFGGTAKDKFSPNMPMTRGMFVTVLARLANVDASSYKESSFKDVNKAAYYMPYIEWASKNGIASGISATTFAPDQAITREQMAVIMVNYAKTIGFEFPKKKEENSFADDAKISSYAKSAVKQMQMAGILEGKNGNQFEPQGTATRAEVCAMMKRFVELVEKN